MYVKKRVGVWDLMIHSWRPVAVIALVTIAVTVVHLERYDAVLQVSIALAGVGTAVSFFIAFFTSQAYDRWWEARKIWGEIVNDSRSFGRLVMTLIPDVHEPSEQAGTRERLIRRHIAYLYAVKRFLRREDSAEVIARLVPGDADRVVGMAHPGNALLRLQGEEVDAAERAGVIDVIRQAQLNGMLNRFSTSMGAAERIKTTVFPPYYGAMIRLAIWGYVVVFALSLSELIGYAAIPYVFAIGAVFRLVYEAGNALLEPFEGEPNDIPMSAIVRTIEINLLQELGETELPPPVEPVNGRYLM